MTVAERVAYNKKWLHSKTEEEKKQYWKERYACYKARKAIHPWMKAYRSIYTRLWAARTKYIDYRGKKPAWCYENVKMLLTVDQLREIWFRDKAYLMKSPSIDRIDSSGDYSFENTRYCELSENIRRPKTRKYESIGS